MNAELRRFFFVLLFPPADRPSHPRLSAFIGGPNSFCVYLRILLELAPAYAIAYNDRGFAKYSIGDHKGAIADLERALEINPDYELAKRNLRLVREKLQK